jgi:hypothetical protein
VKALEDIAMHYSPVPSASKTFFLCDFSLLKENLSVPISLAAATASINFTFMQNIKNKNQ